MVVQADIVLLDAKELTVIARLVRAIQYPGYAYGLTALPVRDWMPRLKRGMTAEVGAGSRSRGMKCPSLARHRPSKTGGRREGWCVTAPAASRADETKHTSMVTTGTPNRSGLPCATVFRLIRALPGVPGLLATTARNRLASWIPASGDRDHTISPSALAHSSEAPQRPSHPAFHVRDDA
jgi:hypothetical protein